MYNANVCNSPSWLDQYFTDIEKSRGNRTVNFKPAVDISEDKEDYVLRAELPGVNKEDIKIEVIESRLVIGGKKTNAVERKEGEYRYIESTYGTFSRTFELPRNVTGDAIRAEYNNGVLTLRIAKAKEAVSRTIDIQ
jgi:HSP20 family protein